MPRLSDTMTEGVIAAWHKKVGDTVKKGDLLAEVETDKATMELESYKDGVLLHIGAEKGSKLQVNDLLAIIGKSGEDISSLLSSAKPAAAAAPSSNATEASPAAAVPATTTAAPAAPATAAQPLDLSKIEEVVLMPRLSDTMEAGVIASWNKQVGDTVKKGDVLADIETDKATMELESYKNGTLLYIGAKQGEKIPVNGLLCIIGEKGKVDIDDYDNRCDRCDRRRYIACRCYCGRSTPCSVHSHDFERTHHCIATGKKDRKRKRCRPSFTQRKWGRRTDHQIGHRPF
jgi:pyruvate dehydrogenase E2 component (dihydrolipoamide acetyltransferase)